MFLFKFGFIKIFKFMKSSNVSVMKEVNSVVWKTERETKENRKKPRRELIKYRSVRWNATVGGRPPAKAAIF